jgi:hypothetical protein
LNAETRQTLAVLGGIWLSFAASAGTTDTPGPQFAAGEA